MDLIHLAKSSLPLPRTVCTCESTIRRPLLENAGIAPYNAGAMSQPISSPTRNFETIAIVGVGLIGGSIALAVKARGVARCVIGVGRNGTRLEDACRNRAWCHPHSEIKNGNVSL